MEKNIFGVAKKKVLITGGTRGIGLALARGFQRAGAEVWIHGSRKESTQKTAEENGFHYVYGNLKEPDIAAKIVQELAAATDKLDVLINNAGCEVQRAAEEAKGEEIEKLFRVNLYSPVMLVKEALPLLKKSDYASIINITSIHQQIAYKRNSMYCMSKAALEMYTKVSALELAQYGIRVNSIAPGAVLTDINAEIVNSMNFEEWIPMGRVGSTEEIVGPAIFLASSASSYMTGTTVFVDGGYKENLLRY